MAAAKAAAAAGRIAEGSADAAEATAAVAAAGHGAMDAMRAWSDCVRDCAGGNDAEGGVHSGASDSATAGVQQWLQRQRRHLLPWAPGGRVTAAAPLQQMVQTCDTSAALTPQQAFHMLVARLRRNGKMNRGQPSTAVVLLGLQLPWRPEGSPSPVGPPSLAQAAPCWRACEETASGWLCPALVGRRRRVLLLLSPRMQQVPHP